MAGHEETIRRFADAFGRRDTDAALELLHPECELVPIRAQLEGGSYRGHDGFKALFADFDEDWASLRLELEDVFENGDHAVTTGRLRARGRASGVDLDIPLSLVYEFRDDRIVRLETFADTDEALRAAGIVD